MSEAVVNGGVPGWFGKMPNLGDFASRRLPDGFVHRWDSWLQSGMAEARDDLTQDWLAGYLVAPIHRFWLAPGLLGEAGWAGLLMPSVDRVGRHFPLTLAQPLAALDAALAARDWYASLDTVARQVLDVHFTVDDLERALAGLADAPPARLDDAARRLAQRLLDGGDGAAARSVWWCDDAREAARFDCYAELPSPSALAAMLGARR